LACQILDIVGSQIEGNNFFSIVGILIGLRGCWFGTQNLNQRVLISKNWPNDPHFGCEAFVGVKSFDDFGDVEAKFLDQIEEEFEDQVDHYVKHVDMVAFDF
jgi:hypothetical protein